MALHQLREALLIALESEAFQQLSVVQVVCKLSSGRVLDRRTMNE
jgi:hypothetical protein